MTQMKSAPKVTVSTFKNEMEIKIEIKVNWEVFELPSLNGEITRRNR